MIKWLTDSTYILYDRCIICKLCGHTSYDENDRKNLYCPKCKTNHVRRVPIPGIRKDDE